MLHNTYRVFKSSPPLATRRLAPLLLLALLVFSKFSFANTDADIWNDVQNGSSIVIIRHAIAPGNGDPQYFELGRCETQRNLSSDGLKQAQFIGQLLKARGVTNAALYTSQWCRCIDTATAMDLSAPIEKSELNSFYSNPQDGDAQIEKLTDWLSALKTNKPIVLITHQVVISALTKVYPASGEIVIFKLTPDKQVKVITQIKTQ